MNSVPGALLSLEPPMVIFSGITSSVVNVFNSIAASDFLSMAYILENKFLLENTWAYIFQYNYFVLPSIVYNSHIPSNLFSCNIISYWYMYNNDITSDRISPCVVLLSVYFPCSIPTYHSFLRSSDNIDYWSLLDWIYLPVSYLEIQSLPAIV